MLSRPREAFAKSLARELPSIASPQQSPVPFLRPRLGAKKNRVDSLFSADAPKSAAKIFSRPARAVLVCRDGNVSFVSWRYESSFVIPVFWRNHEQFPPQLLVSAF
jgi:hypothetical protein